MDVKQQIIIRYLNGDGQRKIAKELHVSRNTIRKYVNEYNVRKQELLNNNILMNKNEIIDDIVAEPTYDSSNRSRRKISNECIDLIKMCLIENKQKRATGKSKQQLKATDIYDLLINKGYDISYPSVSNIVRSLKDTLNEAYIKQEYSLGNICEFDWGEVKLNIDNKGFKKYQLAVFTTAYGNYRFAVLFETQDTIAFQQSHALFFEHVGGIYNTMVYDNMKVAVAKFVGHNEKQPTKGLLTLSTYYGFNFRFCNIRSGNEKGHVERSVEYVRRKAFAFKDTFNSLEDANKYLLEICNNLNNKPLTTDKNIIPIKTLKQEIPYLLPKLPMLDCADIRECRVDKYSCIMYKQNRYSVLDKFVGQIVLVKAYANKIIVFFDNVKIAEHIRTFGLFDWNIKLEHYLNTLHKKSGALENSTAMLNLDTQIKNIYNKYFTQNPKEFLDLYEIILEKGLNNVQKAIEELEKISPIDISAEKVKLICNKKIIEENIDTVNDEIAVASSKLLIQYKSLVPNSNVQFIRQEVMI